MITLPRPVRERRVFIDSSAYLALLDQDDEQHDAAVIILDRIAQQRYRQFTTNTLLIEAHALILSTLGRTQAASFLQRTDAGTTTIVRVRLQDEEAAKRIIYRYSDKDFSLTDAISFVVMERLDIQFAFTFDHHFAQYGFTMVTPELL